MRIRSTKPEFWRSERIAQVDWDARLVLKGLESFVDDNGVGKDDIALIVGDLFQRDLVREPSRTLARVSEAISCLNLAGLVWRYEAEGTRLLYVSFWESVQRVDKPQSGRFPRPDGTMNYKDSFIREAVANVREDSRNVAPGTGEQGNRGTGERGTSSSATPPRQDVEDLCAHLRDRVLANGGKANISEKWRTEARLLIDRDNVDIEVAHRLIDWCQDDSFWHSNILSMPKFREKYQQLLLKARASTSSRPSGRGANGLTPREMEIANAELLKEHPDQSILDRAGLSQPANLRAINGGAS